MLSKIYLILAFIILLSFAILLALQIIQTQKLNKDLKTLKANNIGPTRSADVSFKLANLYFKKGMHNEAIEEYTYCLEVWEKNDQLGIVFLLNRLVLTYSLLKEEAVALYYCKTALSIAPSSSQSLLNLNRLYDSIKLNKASI
jgi:tetratricopeptide (TPR) repeat protein